MAIKKQDWELSQRGLKDAARHRQKIRESIQKNIAEIISDTSIITRKKGQVVKVPIRGLKSYRFVYKRESSGGTGLGQGEGDKGDVIGRHPINDGQPGRSGDQPGVDYLETEIDIEELIEMMLQDLGLPNLKEKAVAEMESPRGWKFRSIEKTGIIAHLDKKRTVKEAVRRTTSFVRELMKRTGKPEEACKNALALARGDLLRAEKMLKEGEASEQTGEALSLFSEDLRYRTLEKDVEYHSNAVILAMMDVSGSMDTIKKYLARSFFFWLVEFLKQIYNNVQIRFIAHTTEARLVDEHEFFHKGESGGTFCYSAYDLAAYLVETEYSPNRWNVYPFHFSDGEDFDPSKTVTSAKRLMDLGVNMLGYGEIRAELYPVSRLMDTFARMLQLRNRQFSDSDFEVFFGPDGSTPFVGTVLKDKSHVYLALKEFLRKERTL
jgi:sporulation protein YhbH